MLAGARSQPWGAPAGRDAGEFLDVVGMWARRPLVRRLTTGGASSAGCAPLAVEHTSGYARSLLGTGTRVGCRVLV